MNKMYLGDGLYVENDGYHFRLFTERETGVVHEVFLDSQVLTNFLRYIQITKEKK